MKPEVAERRYEEIVTDMTRALAARGPLTDVNPGSVVRTLVEAFAREMREVYAALGVIWEMTHIDTATGQGLDELVALLGMKRLDGQYLKADAVFTRAPQVSGRVVLPASMAVQVEHAGETPVFVTEREAELQAGQAQVTVPIQMALPKGADAGKILADDRWEKPKLVIPMAGIQSVELPRPPVLRGYQESDDDLRRRAKSALAAAGGGTAKALENALLATGHVQAVAFQEYPETESPGMLRVLIQADPEAYEEIRATVDRHKAPGIVVDIKGIGIRTLAFRRLVIRPAVANLSGKERQTLTLAVQQKVARLVGGLRTGEKLVWNRLLAELLQVDGVVDVTPETEMTVDGALCQPQGGLLPADLQPLERLVLAQQDGVVVELAGEPSVLMQLLCRTAGLTADDKANLLKGLKEKIDATKPADGTSLTYSALANALLAVKGLSVVLNKADLRFILKGANGAEKLLKQDADALNLTARDVIALDPGGPNWAPDEQSWGEKP